MYHLCRIVTILPKQLFRNIIVDVQVAHQNVCGKPFFGRALGQIDVKAVELDGGGKAGAEVEQPDPRAGADVRDSKVLSVSGCRYVGVEEVA